MENKLDILWHKLDVFGGVKEQDGAYVHTYVCVFIGYENGMG